MELAILRTQLQLANAEIVRSAAGSNVISGAAVTSLQGPPREYFGNRDFSQLGLAFNVASGRADKSDVTQSQPVAMYEAPRAGQLNVTMQQARVDDRLLSLGGRRMSTQGSQAMTSSGQLYRAGPHAAVSTVSVCSSRLIDIEQASCSRLKSSYLHKLFVGLYIARRASICSAQRRMIRSLLTK